MSAVSNVFSSKKSEALNEPTKPKKISNDNSLIQIAADPPKSESISTEVVNLDFASPQIKPSDRSADRPSAFEVLKPEKKLYYHLCFSCCQSHSQVDLLLLMFLYDAVASRAVVFNPFHIKSSYLLCI